MQDNVLVGVLLAIVLVTPAFAWLFYLWHRSHVARMHQEGQIFNRRNRDRAQANYESANGARGPIFGPYFTPSGWVRPKARGLSHDLRPPQYVHPRQPTFTGNPNSDQHFQGPNQVSTHSPPHTANQQPNPLSKRQQRKQRALQNKQKQQQEREQQQSQNDQRGKQNRNQRKQKNNNQGQNHQKSPTVHSPKAQERQDEQYDPWKNTEGQNDRTSNHGGSGWGKEETPQDNQDNTGQNDKNSDWGNNFHKDQGEQRNSASGSPQRGSRENHNSPQERGSRWDNNFNNEQGERRNSASGSPRRGSRENHNNPRERSSRWDNSRPASPDRASGNDAEFLRGGWGQSDDGAQRNSHSRSNHSNEDNKRSDGWGDDNTKIYHKENKRTRHAPPERMSRGRSSPNRDWEQNDHGKWGNGHNSRNRSRSNSWGHAEKRRGGGSPTWSQDRNVHRDKKKKERWQIELEENEKMRRGRSRSRERSDAGWDNRSKGSGWKETQKW
ncbi:hypothetical protein PENSOL_c001G12081 [Penicillium solitum]|uniref:Uncharacterized protein n=1 Tax=Penicillium solitum TaxID=60172 RepID=A0A1V6RQG2_9EURO|nr:uncharacterized protein PENSOL_c001G12081 [Penicillium solitum]OQE04011.1 hypothetical protein PENSOL_c001G12081 [Penicillium solitum]